MDNLGVSVVYSAILKIHGNTFNIPYRACIYYNIDPEGEVYANDCTSGGAEFFYVRGGTPEIGQKSTSNGEQGNVIRNSSNHTHDIFHVTGGYPTLDGYSNQGMNAMDVAQTSGHDVNNSTSNTLAAKNNLWGTDNSGLFLMNGGVDYNPYLHSNPYANKSSQPSFKIDKTFVVADSLVESNKFKDGYQIYKVIADTSNKESKTILALIKMSNDARIGGFYYDFEKDVKKYIDDKRVSVSYRAQVLLAKLYLYTDRFKDCEKILTSFEAGTFQEHEALLHLLDYYFVLSMKEKAAGLEQTMREHFPKDEGLENDFKYSEELPIYVSEKDLQYSGGLGKIGNEEKPEVESSGFSVYPNPFNATVKIRFNVDEQSHVNLVIFNTLGQKVRTLADQRMEQGSHEILWNGLDDFGIQVSTGLYFVSLFANNKRQIAKMVFAK